jgi:hypothetical protein
MAVFEESEVSGSETVHVATLFVDYADGDGQQVSI